MINGDINITDQPNSKKAFIPPTKSVVGSSANNVKDIESKLKKTGATVKQVAKSKTLKKDSSKVKFGNKEFKATKKYNFFSDLAKDVRLSVGVQSVPAPSVNKDSETESPSQNIIANIDDITQEEVPDTEVGRNWNMMPLKTVPKSNQIKAGRSNCGDCQGCKTVLNCTKCKFCLKPSLKKKCETRLCIRKLKIKDSTHENVNHITSSQEEVEDIEVEIIQPEFQPARADESIDIDNPVELAHQDETNRKEKKFKCSKCGKTFQFPKWLINHMKKGNCQETVIRSKHCTICDKLVRIEYFKKHLKIHGAPMIKCDKCNGSFKTTQTLQAHKKAIHDPKPISKVAQKCGYCEKAFLHMSLLRQHISKYHYIKEVECDECDSVFATNSGLRRHMKHHKTIISLEIEDNVFN